MLIVRASVAGRGGDVRLAGGVVAEIGPSLRPVAGEDVVDAAGGTLLPGLHDHHLHLLALAAADRSVLCGPPAVMDRSALATALRTAPADGRDGWVRGVGYAETVAGPLDRDGLDLLVSDRPVRVQHRGGALWVLNSAALDLLGLDRVADPDVERDSAGRLTGRLWRWDARLRALLRDPPPDLGAVGRRLARYGITGVTDATPDLPADTRALLGAAAADGRLPLELRLLGAPTGDPAAGPWKLLLRDHDLPPLDALTASVAASHAAGRPVAVHCVTREALVLTLAALSEAGRVAGDRIEHGAVVPPSLHRLMGGLRVVTQPVFVADRGDSYLADVEPGDLPYLYPYASLLAAGIPAAPSSDAPFGDPDPWRGIAAAATRRTAGGVVLGAGERVPAAVALDGYLSGPDDPGGPPRRVAVGAAADLCLLAVPLADALREPSSDLVRATFRAGTLTY